MPGSDAFRAEISRLRTAGHLAEAERLLRDRLSNRPDDLDSLYELVELLAATGRGEQGLPLLRQAANVSPSSGRPHALAARILVDLGRPEPAAAALSHALQLNPDDVDAWYELGRVQYELNRYDAARESYDTVLRHDPEHLDALSAKARLLERTGEAQAAWALLAHRMEAGCDHVNMVLAFASVCRTLKRERAGLEAIARAQALPGLVPEQRRLLAYRAGDLLDRTGEYDAAFACYAEANRNEDPPGDPDMYTDRVDQLIATFSAAKIRRMERAANRSGVPVFVVGMPRSGTTLAEQILASHPRIHGAGELRNIDMLAHAMPRLIGVPGDYPGCMEQAKTQHLDRAAAIYLDHIRELAPKVHRVVNKMPQDFYHLGLIERLFPGARIIHCVRNPVDTCLSCFFQSFGSAQPYTSDLAVLGHYYQEYRRLMAHWEKVMTLPLFTLRYEELVAEPESVSRALVAFVGLDWDDACLSFYKQKRTVRTASYDQVRQPVYTRSVARWKRYETHLGPLIEALGPYGREE